MDIAVLETASGSLAKCAKLLSGAPEISKILAFSGPYFFFRQ